MVSNADNDTLTSGPNPVPETDPDSLAGKTRSVETLDHFRLERRIGQGGMGQVWEAWDTRLERRVAIKRLHVADPDARRRFLREARLQATLAHPGICPVFEVGQDNGEPYLVMPFLAGLPLDQAVEGAALEHKLDLISQVAEAVHAAHSHGLIHRDLKPANILVETPDDAPPRPIVLDFGIARPLDGGRLTASGDIVGTPSFMAPEQVEGLNTQLDRRTDVYALGATLYCLLAGRPPHKGQGASLMVRILHEEPERLKPAGIPSEVEAILFKCLEKTKDERYDSALALAEDLRRYLAGKPVRARPITPRIRLVKWLRRHRVTVRVAALATLLSLAALAWGTWSAWRSDERQRLARQFGAQIEEIEALARYSHLVPLHDIRPDQAELRRHLEAIRSRLDDDDPVARALAHHALGRGHLALDELETARGHLDTANALAPNNPEIEADLGRTLSELYRERLTTLERTRDPVGRDSVREQLSRRLAESFRKPGEQQKQWQRTLGDPARDLLLRGRSPEVRNALELETLILFHEGRPEAALERLAAAPPTPSWTYERWHLEGDIRRSWAADLYHSDEANDAARQQLELARRAYQHAMEIARSHAAILRDDVQTVVLLIRWRLVSLEEIEPLIDEARTRLRKARRIHPEDLQTWLWTARLESAAADHQSRQDRDPTAYLQAALESSRTGLQLDHQNSALWYQLGRAHEKLARWQRDRGEDSTAEFRQAAEAFAQVAEDDQDYSYFTSLGILQMTAAGHLNQLGLDAGAAYESAFKAYHKAAELHSEPFAALSNLGLALLNASHLKGGDSQNLLTQAIQVFQHAHELEPDHMAPFYYLGLCRIRLAQGGHVARTIVDPTMAERARADFERATELAPERFHPWVGLGELFHLQALAAYTHGNDPTSYFVQAREAHQRALALVPDQPIALLNLAWTAYFEGKYALRDGLDPTTQLAEAERLCRRALEARRRPNNLLCLGSVRRLQAEYLVVRDELASAASRIADAKGLFEEILEIDTDHAEVHRSLGRLLTLEARRRRTMHENPQKALNEARRFIDRALELEDAVLYFHLADANWYLEQAEWLRATDQEFVASVEAGRRSLAKAFERVRDSYEATRLESRFAALR